MKTLDPRRGRGPASEKGVFALLIVVVGMVLHSGCNRRPADMSGTYLGNYFGGQETLILQRDGSFSQQFVLSGSPLYSNTGRWALNGSKAEVIMSCIFTRLNQVVDRIFGKGINVATNNIDRRIKATFDKVFEKVCPCRKEVAP